MYFDRKQPQISRTCYLRRLRIPQIKVSTQQVTKTESKASEKLKLRQGTYSSIFLRGGYKIWSKTERTRVRSFSLAFTRALTSLSSYSNTKDVTRELSSLMDGVCYKRGFRALFILLQGRYWAWRQLHAGKTVMLDFHAKGEHQRLTSGAGRLGVASDLPLPSRGRS